MEFYVNIIKMFDRSAMYEVSQNLYLKSLNVKLHYNGGRFFYINSSLANNFIDKFGNSDDLDVVDFVVWIWILLIKKNEYSKTSSTHGF